MTKCTSSRIDINHLRSWIGREETATDVVAADLVRKFRATFDQAPGEPQVGDLAPPLIHYCLGQPAALTNMLDDDGHPRRGGFLPPIPLPRRMWAGGGITFHEDLHVGDVVRRVSRIVDVAVKEGRTGTLCFVTVAHEIDAAGRPILSEMQDIVYCGAKSDGPRKAPSLATVGRYRRVIDLSPVLLFRYSALTFNGHRIHYDRSYAIEVEGYPGLVVHGPLQATLLFNYATDIRGRAPSRFTFRSLTPLFDSGSFNVNAEADDGKLKLWTARDGGALAMTAEAEWA